MQTKSHLLAILCIAILVGCGNQNPPPRIEASSSRSPAQQLADTKNEKVPYIITVPPQSHEDFHNDVNKNVKKWTSRNKVDYLDSDKKQKVHHADKPDPKDPMKKIKGSRGHMFRLLLTPAQADAFAKDKDFDDVFIEPEQEFEPPPPGADDFEYDFQTKGQKRIYTWPETITIPIPGTVDKEGDHTPVLYVVDSGVQWMTNATGNPTHTQFSSSRIKFLNGRVPPSVGD